MSNQAHTARSLIFVVRQTLPKVRSLSSRLGRASAREKDSILRQLEKSASILSQALTRLSDHAEFIDSATESRSQAPARMPPPSVLGLQAAMAAWERGLCPICEGILPKREPPGKVEPDPHQLFLAARAKSRAEHVARSADWPDAAARDRALRAVDQHDDT